MEMIRGVKVLKLDSDQQVFLRDALSVYGLTTGKRSTDGVQVIYPSE